MKKLSLEDLKVESFSTENSAGMIRGTAHAMQSPAPAYTCGQACISYDETGCDNSGCTGGCATCIEPTCPDTNCVTDCGGGGDLSQGTCNVAYETCGNTCVVEQ